MWCSTSQVKAQQPLHDKAGKPDILLALENGSPFCYLRQPLRPERPFSVNVECLALSSAHVNGELQQHNSYKSAL
jgi:hypothetical protein